MQPNYHSKTLGTRAADLVMTLHEKRRAVFSVRDVQEITGFDAKAAANFVATLIKRGIATRLKTGLFTLVPFELGREHEYLGNPYVVAKELAGAANYYLSHASAMDLHGMTTQPQFIVYVTSTRQYRPLTVLGTEFRFVRCKPDQLFGVEAQWIDKSERIAVSDLERTVIDGLRQPAYCGGFSDVARGFWIRRDALNVERIVDYALRLNVGAVIRRLGYLLEASGTDAPAEIERLRTRLTTTYQLLDPTLPPEGRRLARWRLRLNVTPEEIEAIRST